MLARVVARRTAGAASTAWRRAASAETASSSSGGGAGGGAGGGGGAGIGSLARGAVSLAIAGATAVVCESVLNDLVLWRIARDRAIPVIDANDRLKRSLGTPLRADAWWNASVTTRARGNLVTTMFLLDGSKASCDVQVVMIRDKAAADSDADAGSPANAFIASVAPNLFANAWAPSRWKEVRVEAILPHEKEAGLPGRVDLLRGEEEGASEPGLGGKKKKRSAARGRWGDWFRRGRDSSREKRREASDA
mgnify:CR=1 FL=1